MKFNSKIVLSTLTADKTWILDGLVAVKAGSTLSYTSRAQDFIVPFF